MIKEDKLRLPTFQRNYVWEKTDIVKLVSTLFSDNTFGAISAIKTTMGYPIFSTRSFIDDLRDKYQLTESNFTPNYTSDDPLYLILDGQQRLQSFYLAFDGDFDKEELFFNTQDCTVSFYETSPNNNWIPIKKLYNKMIRVSYEQTAKFFGKDKNENIFKFFYHIFFTKRITFLISEPSNELRKDRERFTNLFIKVNTSGKGLDKWEIYRCIIMGMKPETGLLFNVNIETESVLTIIYVCTFGFNRTMIEGEQSQNSSNFDMWENRIKSIIETIDTNVIQILPNFIKSLLVLTKILNIGNSGNEYLISDLFSTYKIDINKFDILDSYLNYLFLNNNRFFVKEDDCRLLVLSIVIERLKILKSIQHYWKHSFIIYFHVERISDTLCYLNIETLFNPNKREIFFMSLVDHSIFIDVSLLHSKKSFELMKEIKLINFKKVKLSFNLSDTDIKTILEERKKELSNLWCNRIRELII